MMKMKNTIISMWPTYFWFTTTWIVIPSAAHSR
jgi:hypothetical protein